MNTSKPSHPLPASVSGPTPTVSIVRQNLLIDPGYAPYCGNEKCAHHWPRTKFNGSQFECSCGWRSTFEPEFIAQIARNTLSRAGASPADGAL